MVTEFENSPEELLLSSLPEAQKKPLTPEEAFRKEIAQRATAAYALSLNVVPNNFSQQEITRGNVAWNHLMRFAPEYADALTNFSQGVQTVDVLQNEIAASDVLGRRDSNGHANKTFRIATSQDSNRAAVNAMPDGNRIAKRLTEDVLLLQVAGDELDSFSGSAQEAHQHMLANLENGGLIASRGEQLRKNLQGITSATDIMGKVLSGDLVVPKLPQPAQQRKAVVQ